MMERNNYEYFCQLVEQDRQRMRQMVTITAYEGYTVTKYFGDGRAPETQTAKLSARQASAKATLDEMELRSSLIESVALDPKTGHAKDLDFIRSYVNRIYSEPTSPRPFLAAVHYIEDILRADNYPASDRKEVLNILNAFCMHHRCDICSWNEVQAIIRSVNNLTKYLESK